MHEKLMQCYN